MKLTYNLFLFLIAGLTFSCQSSGNKLAKLTPGTNAYRQELAQQINSKKVACTLNKYHNENGREYLSVNIKDGDIDTKSDILITNWTNLEGIKRTKGVSYRGAELKGLTIEVEGDELVYKGLEQVVD